jgi:hypothetical protein
LLRDDEGGLEPCPHALERELAVARLAARVLRDGADDGAEPRADAALLLVVQRAGRIDVEHGLDA